MGFCLRLKNLFIETDNSSSSKDSSISVGSVKKGAKKLSQNIGETEAICPYCHKKLEKKPSRKTKCPHCENYIYKRTRPFDDADILIRKDQIDQIDEEWSIVNGSHDIYLKEKHREKRIRDGMRERFGKEPADDDVEFRVLNDQAVEAEFAGDWGFARNYRLNMAKNLEKRKSHELSLRMYFHVCFLDINGPNNRSGMQSVDLDKYPYFTPKSGFLAPGVIKRMKKLISKLEFDEEDCKQGFVEVNKPIFEGSPTPLSPETAWLKLKKELIE